MPMRPRPLWRPPLLLLGLVALLLAAPAPADEKEEARRKASEERLRKDIEFLASDECEGRGPDTAGINRAADYIAKEFKEAGLKPGGPDGSYFQPFKIAKGSAKFEAAKLTLYGPLGQGEFLRRLGIEARAARLRAEAVAVALGRLVGQDQMGTLFKVLAMVSPGLTVPAGFEQ